jgi:deoxyribonuclease II
MMKCALFFLAAVACAPSVTARYTNCSQYESESGCKGSSLGCRWENGHCSAAGPAPGPSHGGLSCLDNNGKEVDWWVAFKAPGGFSFAYRDANSDGSSSLEILSGVTLDEKSSCFGATVQQIFEDKESTAYASWNDECPDDAAQASRVKRRLGVKAAHSKGVLAFDGKNGFWVVHSVPKMVNMDLDSFQWTGDDTYGQSFLCMSLNTDNVEVASHQIQALTPGMCYSNMPSSLAEDVPTMASLINGEDVDTLTSMKKIQTTGNTEFTSFAKSRKWGEDLYVDFVEQEFRDSFFWETWRRSPEEDSNCTGTYTSLNVENVDFGGGNTWSYTRDHSKYGVSQDAGTPITCIGGINRMTSQRQRGGGTVCLEDKPLHAAVSAVISDVEKCPSTGN